MTEEQIKQKANEFATHINGEKSPFSSREYEAYIAGAHSRDEEIKELNSRLEARREELFQSTRRITELEMENNKLRNPWISVEEGLPFKEKEDDVFLDCFVKLADGCTAICYFFYDSQIWSPLKDCYVLFDKGRMRVTHWMPIPQLKENKL